MIRSIVAASLVLASGVAMSAPVAYNIMPQHTFPSFEADHSGGLSIWRGKFNSSTGKVTLDKEAKTGSVEITVDTTSVDFGFDPMTNHAKKDPTMLDVEKYPTATYKGTFSKWNGDAPAEVTGELTLHGVTKPLTLTINSFLCKMNPMLKKEVCGADASASFNRDDFGIDFGKQGGVKMGTKLAIQVEAVKAD